MGWPKGQSVRFGGKMELLALPGIEPRFMGPVDLTYLPMYLLLNYLFLTYLLTYLVTSYLLTYVLTS